MGGFVRLDGEIGKDDRRNEDVGHGPFADGMQEFGDFLLLGLGG